MGGSYNVQGESLETLKNPLTKKLLMFFLCSYSAEADPKETNPHYETFYRNPFLKIGERYT